MKILKSVIATIGLIYLTNISLVSIFPLIILTVFLAIYSKIEIVKDKKVYISSLMFSLLYFLFFLRKEFVFSIKYILIFISLYLIFELLLSYLVGNKNV
ncbi:MAG: hypothetical protein MR840_07725 [Solobacterium sp.]|nr:hypothetical protein [Solobacterium sp.]MCI6878669.1 hypothetical protein [Solobacterium sp.]